jgi:hypothetical protein
MFPSSGKYGRLKSEVCSGTSCSIGGAARRRSIGYIWCDAAFIVEWTDNGELDFSCCFHLDRAGCTHRSMLLSHKVAL